MEGPVRVGIFSYGMSGRVFHAPLLHVHPGFVIRKVMQRNASDATLRYPYARVVRTASELYDDPEIDLIIVNTPDNTHYELARKALLAGKHVVVEKPFVLEVEEGRELIELAGKRARLLTVFQNRRWEGDFLTVRKIINEGWLGRLVSYEAHFDRYRNYIRDSWKEKPENRTGTLYNLGSHLIDQSLQLFGMPEAVFADVRNQRTHAAVDDSFDVYLYYAGLKVLLRGSYLVREPGPRFILHGTEGSYVKYGVDPQEDALQSGRFPDEPGWGSEEEDHWGLLNTTIGGMHFRGRVETLAGCYQQFYSDLYEAIVHGKEPAVKPEESLNVIRIIRAAYESSLNRKVIGL